MSMQAASFAVYGMHCASCAVTIEKRLTAEPGVTDAIVNLSSERATVRFDPMRTSPDAIERAVAESGYRASLLAGAQADERQQQEQRREQRTGWIAFWSSAVLAAGVLLLSMVFTNAPHRGWWEALLATPVQFVFGWRFYRGTWAALRNRSANMDTLIALGTSAAYFYSLANLLRGSADLFFETSALLIAFVLLGKSLEARAKARTSDAIRALMKLAPKRARVIHDGREIEVDAADVQVGDQLIVRPGEAFAVDGEVIGGTSSADESMLTGESMPVAKVEEDPVYAGTLNVDGTLHYRSTKIGRDTALAAIVRLVEEAQTGKAPIQRFADRVSAVFVPIVIVIALATLAFWSLIGHAAFGFALMAAVSVAVIACPCALGLATPTALMVGIGRGAQSGILIRDGGALEAASHLDTILLDKTGTVTRGKPAVTDVAPFDGVTPESALWIAAAIERYSEHPIARAILAESEHRGIDPAKLPEVRKFRAEPGRGVRGEIDGSAIVAGSPDYVASTGVELGAQTTMLQNQGKTVIAVARDHRPIAAIGVADQLKEGVTEAVADLRQLGANVVLVTGDNRQTAQAIAREAGIQDVRAEVLPAQKVDVVHEFQRQGRRVAFVGDGVNDAPAIAASDLGMALGSGADVAAQAGAIVLVRNDVRDVVRALHLARATYSKIKGGMFWALAYNVLGIPIAAGALYPWWHVMLRPEIAGAAMALSSVSVVTNALLLKRTRI